MIFNEQQYFNFELREYKPITYEVNENECWNCTSHRLDKDGYPRVKRFNKHLRMSRYIYSIINGEIEKGLIILHSCDNPNCINPKHLRVGTTRENNIEAVSKGRNCIGDKNSQSKLTKEDVEKIRKDNRKSSTIAREYNVYQSTISDIKAYRTWKNF
jgi:hypothetical protein